MSIRVQTRHAKPHSICFFYHSINQQRRGFFLRARAEKGFALHIDASSVVWTLIDNDILPDQITTLEGNVIKIAIS